MEEGVAGAVGEFGKAESLIAVEPLDGCSHRRTVDDRCAGESGRRTGRRPRATAAPPVFLNERHIIIKPASPRAAEALILAHHALSSPSPAGDSVFAAVRFRRFTGPHRQPSRREAATDADPEA